MALAGAPKGCAAAPEASAAAAGGTAAAAALAACPLPAAAPFGGVLHESGSECEVLSKRRA